jgi:hypothetical protein
VPVTSEWTLQKVSERTIIRLTPYIGHFEYTLRRLTMGLFRKKQHWFIAPLKAMVFALIFFKIAMGFKKKSQKMNSHKIRTVA